MVGATKDNPHPRGRILKLKQGYNPNSSSIGTIVFAMPAALLGLTVLFGTATGILLSAFLPRLERRRSERLPETERAPDTPQE